MGGGGRLSWLSSRHPFILPSIKVQKMRKIYFLIVFLSASLLAFAQINESDTVGFQLQLRSGGSYQTGNVELLRVTNQLDVSTRISSDLVFKTQNNYFYQRFFGNKADEDLASSNYLYLQPENILYPYAISFISTNFRRDLDLRTFTGLGLTYQLLQKTAQTVKLSANVLYEQSTYRSQVFNYQEFNGSEHIKAFWSTLYLRGFHPLKEAALKLTYELYWQQSLADRVNYRYHLLAGLDLSVRKGFSIQSRIVYAYENLVTTRVKQKDLLWTWGLAYQFKSK